MPRIFPVLIVAILATIVIAACGGDTATPSVERAEIEKSEGVQVSVSPLLWRYVNSGWVSPVNEQYTNAFTRELRVAVITSAQEMDQFNRMVISKRTFGTGTTLGRPEFPGSVVLAGYLLWLPVQGDPLSVVGLKIDGNRAVVDLELEVDAQGREYPYLYAPMTMVTVDRDEFPAEGPVSVNLQAHHRQRVTLHRKPQQIGR
jgi:hypothetical protein